MVTDSSYIYFAGNSDSSTIYANSVGYTNTGSKTDIFVFKRDASGTINWFKSVGGDYDYYVYGLALDTSSTYLYLVGEYYSTYLWDSNVDYIATNSDVSASSLSSDALLLMITASSGTSSSAKSAGSDDKDDAFRSIAIDSSNNILVAGDFSSSPVYMDNYPWAYTNRGRRDVVIIQAQASLIDGVYEVYATWTGVYGGTKSDYGYSIATASDYVFITGCFASSTATFGTMTMTKTTYSTRDVFSSVLYVMNLDLDNDLAVMFMIDAPLLDLIGCLFCCHVVDRTLGYSDLFSDTSADCCDPKPNDTAYPSSYALADSIIYAGNKSREIIMITKNSLFFTTIILLYQVPSALPTLAPSSPPSTQVGSLTRQSKG